MDTTKRLLGHIFIACIVLGASNGVMAADKPMICAVTHAISCVKDGDCKQGTANEINIPLFLRINPGKKEIVSMKEDGKQRVSKIKSSAKDAEKRFFVYQGVEEGGAWSTVVDTTTGSMTVSVAAGETDAYIMYGACSKALLNP